MIQVDYDAPRQPRASAKKLRRGDVDYGDIGDDDEIAAEEEEQDEEKTLSVVLDGDDEAYIRS